MPGNRDDILFYKQLWTLLEDCMRHGRRVIVHLLLNHGYMDRVTKREAAQSCLEVAAECEYFQLMRFSYLKKTNMASRDAWNTEAGCLNSLEAAAISAAKKGKIRSVQWVYNSIPSGHLNSRYDRGSGISLTENVIQEAINNGHLQVVCWLLSRPQTNSWRI